MYVEFDADRWPELAWDILTFCMGFISLWVIEGFVLASPQPFLAAACIFGTSVGLKNWRGIPCRGTRFLFDELGDSLGLGGAVLWYRDEKPEIRLILMVSGVICKIFGRWTEKEPP